MKKGIDISHWQGAVDFAKVKAQGFDFVMIKAGGADAGYYKDSKFESYYAAAAAAGLHIGSYYFTGRNFCTEEQGRIEAQKFLELLKGKRFDYPVAVDVEAVPTSAGRDNITAATVAFCRELERARYYATIYASDYSGFKERLNLAALAPYDKWVAKYSRSGPSIVPAYGMWQYGGSINYLASPKVDGVSSAACDQNYSYKDYPAIIKAAGLNGYAKQTAADPAPADPHEEQPSNPRQLERIVTGGMTSGDVDVVLALLDALGVSCVVEPV